jgi:hypothetical protein
VPLDIHRGIKLARNYLGALTLAALLTWTP